MPKRAIATFQVSCDFAYVTTSRAVSPVSSLAGLTMMAISPATSPSPPSAGRNLPHAGRAISAPVMSSVVVVMSASSLLRRVGVEMV